MNYRFIMKPEDLTTLDTVLVLDLNLILTFTRFAGTSILSGRILSNICARDAAGIRLAQISIFVCAFVFTNISYRYFYFLTAIVAETLAYTLSYPSRLRWVNIYASTSLSRIAGYATLTVSIASHVSVTILSNINKLCKDISRINEISSNERDHVPHASIYVSCLIPLLQKI
jgi:hypothetical protein